MDKISPIKERILQYLDYKGISKQDFCKATTISYANMKGKSLVSEIGGSKLSEILSVYNDISADWLITGNGEMLKNKEDTKIQKDKNFSVIGNNRIKNNSITIDSQLNINESEVLKKEIDALRKEIEHLTAIVNEKERLIQVLMTK